MTDSPAPDRDRYDRIISDHPAREAATILASECRAKDALVAQAQNMIRALGGVGIVTEHPPCKLFARREATDGK